MNPKTTAISRVYEQIRQDIINGLLAPGHKLKIDSMASRYETGVNPVREALSRLSTEGLVEHRDQRGFYVHAMRAAEFRELVKTRCWLDCKALEESISHRDSAWEAALHQAYEALSATPRALEHEERFYSNPQWQSRHRAFHLALLANCGSSWLLRYCEDLTNQAERYRALADAKGYQQRNTPDEHRAIMEHALAGRCPEAVALLQQHYLRTLEFVEKALWQ